MSFSQGHALIIGVGRYPLITGADVPIAVDDARAVEQVIKDSRFCGYPETQVEFLSDERATHAGILAALDRLAQRSSERDTALVFYCGHGARGTDGNFYLVSYDAEARAGRVVPGSGVNEAELLEKLRSLKTQRSLLIFNTCYSGNISPTLGPGELEVETSSLSEDTSAGLLGTGSGRIIITASRETQKSYIGTGKLSIFTQALVDGLHGRGVGNHAGYISAYNLYETIYWSVTEKTQNQEPELTVLKGIGPFAVALYKGASTPGRFDESLPVPETPAVHQVKHEKAQRSYNQILQIHDGAAATGLGAKAVGKDGILIEGNVSGDVIGSGGRKDG